MDLYFKIYLITWVTLTLIWLFLLISNKKNILLFSKQYIDFILIKWKLILFLIAFILLSIMANLWLDPTWDIPETIVMSILTYYTAPYSIWIIYRYTKWLNKNLYEFYIAIILLFFSSAWFYDIYVLLFLLWKYPITAFSNLLLSPFFYLLAWIMWNLWYSKTEWVIFLFTKEDWINYKNDKWYFWDMFIYILPIVIFMIIIFWYFLYLNF